jgi:hypothetical protein
MFVLVAPFMDCIICSLLRTVWVQLAAIGAQTMSRCAHLYPQRDGLQLRAHLVELLDVPAQALAMLRFCPWSSIPSRPHKIFRLDA